MLKKIDGIAFIAAGAVVLFLLVLNGMIFPHLIGPVILVTVGIVLLVTKKKGVK